MEDPPVYSVGPMSLPLRMEAKRKKTRAGAAFLVIGLLLLSLGIFGFARGGAEMLGIWGTALGVGLSALGVFILVGASKAR